MCRLLDHKGTRLRALVLPINKKYQTSRAAYLAKITADQSMFTELLPDQSMFTELLPDQSMFTELLPLHDVVGINSKKRTTTEYQGADIKYIG